MPPVYDSEYILERDILVDAETDGYDLVMPKHTYPAYLQAYAFGLRRKFQDIQRQLAEFEQETAWLDEF